VIYSCQTSSLFFCAIADGGTCLHGSVYHLLAADLRAPPSESLGPALTSAVEGQSPLVSPKLPTLLLFECVLAYMAPSASSRLLEWFKEYFSQTSGADGSDGVLGCVVYEMFGLTDQFGLVMINNLKVCHPHFSEV
jgi:[phosphatase 2A protein]-leucine-carboxy methyltransferase